MIKQHETLSTFRNLCLLARGTLNVSPDRKLGSAARRLRLLPPTLKQVADKIVSSSQARDIAALHGISQLTFGRILQRAGFFHGIVEGHDSRHLWADVRPYLRPRQMTAQTLVLLDCCWFPADRFRLPSGIVQRFTSEQLQALGPKPEIAAAFFPRESLDESWFSRQWFLHTKERRKEKPGVHRMFFNEPDILSTHWPSLLTLALYDVVGFSTPLILESRPGWQLLRLRSGEPMVDSDPDGNDIPAVQYRVASEDWQRFLSFVRFMRRAFPSLHSSQIAKPVARRYLRGIFVSGCFPDVASRDEWEDEFLQHVYGLEMLLSAGDREGIADKLAIRSALLTGVGDERRKGAMYLLTKQIYDLRSALVHGDERRIKKSKDKLSPWKVRGLLRDLLVAFASIRLRLSSDQDWHDLLRKLPYSNQAQRDVIRAARRPLSLTEVAPL